MPLPSVTVAVLNYNGKEHLESCLSSLLALDYPAELLEIVVIDNDSSDGSLEFVQERFPVVVTVQNGHNYGFAEGNNRGVRGAHSEFLAFLNNDMHVDPAWLRELVQPAVAGGDAVGAVASLILNWDGDRVDFAGAAMNFTGWGSQERYGSSHTDKVGQGRPLLFACGGAMLVRRRAVRAPGRVRPGLLRLLRGCRSRLAHLAGRTAGYLRTPLDRLSPASRVDGPGGRGGQGDARRAQHAHHDPQELRRYQPGARAARRAAAAGRTRVPGDLPPAAGGAGGRAGAGRRLALLCRSRGRAAARGITGSWPHARRRSWSAGRSGCSSGCSGARSGRVPVPETETFDGCRDVPITALGRLAGAVELLQAWEHARQKRGSVQGLRERPDAEIFPLFRTPLLSNFPHPRFIQAMSHTAVRFELTGIFGKKPAAPASEATLEKSRAVSLQLLHAMKQVLDASGIPLCSFQIGAPELPEAIQMPEAALEPLRRIDAALWYLPVQPLAGALDWLGRSLSGGAISRGLRGH